MFAVLKAKRAYAKVRPMLGDGSSVLIGLHVTTTFLRLGSNLILTRLLAPEVYGIVGIVTSVSYILTMVSDMGLRAYVTRHPTADERVIQTIWTVRLLRNLVLATIMFLGAGVFAQLYAAPEVTGAIRIASALFLVDAMASMSFLTGERDRRVIRISVISFIRFLFITAVTIGMAVILRNYWAVIISMFAGSLFTVFSSHMLLPGHPVRLRFDVKSAIDLWKFSRFVIPASMISIVLTQTDKFVIANFFPLAELGKFMLATTGVVALNALVSEYIMKVFYPNFAQAVRANADNLLRLYYDPRTRVTLMLAFGIGGLIGGGELVVRLLLNDLYLGTGFYISILCLQPLARLSTAPAEVALISKGFIRASLTANVLRLIWVACAGTAAYFLWGPLAVVIAMCLTEVALLPFFLWNQHRHRIFGPWDELKIAGVAVAGFWIGWAFNALAIWLVAAGYLPSF